MVSFLMIGSLILGLVSWILPTLNIIKSKSNYNKNGSTYSIISMGSCAIAITFQILYSNHIVKIEDWSTLMDTSNTSTLLSVILLVITIILNIISLKKYLSKTIN